MISSLLRFAGAAAATLAAACAVGTYPTWSWGGSDALASMGVAAGVVLLGAIAGCVPLARVSGVSDPARRVSAVLAALGVRLGVTLVGVAVALSAHLPPSRPAFLAWVGVGYVALLLLESAWAVREARRFKPNGSASA